jgi:hypothetical protein
MPYHLTDDEQRALWDVEDVPHGPAARDWVPPDVRAARLQARIVTLERALRGMLALATDDTGALMLQAIAADALGDAATRDTLTARLRERRTP